MKITIKPFEDHALAIAWDTNPFLPTHEELGRLVQNRLLNGKKRLKLHHIIRHNQFELAILLESLNFRAPAFIYPAEAGTCFPEGVTYREAAYAVRGLLIGWLSSRTSVLQLEIKIIG